MKVIVIRLAIYVGVLLLLSFYSSPIQAYTTQEINRINRTQTILTSNIARIADYPGETNSTSQFMQAVDYYIQRGYSIFNFYVGYKPDNIQATADETVRIIQEIDRRSGRVNKYILSYSYDSSRTDTIMVDRLYNGKPAVHSSLHCPNYAFMDVSDGNQRNLWVSTMQQWLSLLRNSAVYSQIIGVMPIYGQWGETGLYIGMDGCTGRNNEFTLDEARYLNNSAGYSVNMLNTFKTFYTQKQNTGVIPVNTDVNQIVQAIDVNNPASWPIPTSNSTQAKAFAYFLMHRKEQQGSFNQQIVNGIRAHDPSLTIAGFCYLHIKMASAANGWSDFPGDLCVTQPGVGLYSNRRKLIEADYVGQNDFMFPGGSESDSAWFLNNTEYIWKLGGNMMTFNRTSYQTNGVAQNLTQYYANRTQSQAAPLTHSREVAILIPSFSRGLLPPLNGLRFGLATLDHTQNIIPILKKYNLAYDFVSENELMDIAYMSKYKLIIIHNQSLFNSLFPGPWNTFLANFGGITVGDNSGSLDYASVENAIISRIVNTANRCESFCNGVDASYVLNNTCLQVCPHAPLVSFPTPTINPHDYDGDGDIDYIDLIKKFINPSNHINIFDFSRFTQTY
jgi:hypothetical protein